MLWLDNDREGENICFEVLDVVHANLKKAEVYRAKFSSVTHPDLRQAFNSLESGPNENESLAVDARQIIDLKVGVPFSRYQTMYFQQKYSDLKEKLITYGPCQTPTLSFCVKRDQEIEMFKPRPFYRLVPKIGNKSNNQMISLEYDESVQYNYSEAIRLKNVIESRREVVVTELVKKECLTQRPEGLNTVSMLKVGSSNLGMGPA